MSANYLAFLVAASFLACEPPDKLRMDFPAFFDMQGFFYEQLRIMDSLNPILQKIAHLENDQDTTIYRPDKIRWSRELEIFQELDLNKPILRDKYFITTKYDSALDREMIRYELKNSGDSGVKYVDIIQEKGLVMQISGEYREKSLLYDALRRHTIFFGHANETTQIKNYSVSGWQKIILQDTTYYRVHADIIYP